MISRRSLSQLCVLSLPFFLLGCETLPNSVKNVLPTSLTILRSTPISKPIQVKYRPFAKLKYRETYYARDPKNQKTTFFRINGPVQNSRIFTVAGENVAGSMAIEIDYIALVGNRVATSADNGTMNANTRLMIGDSGDVKDVVTSINGQIRSSDNAGITQSTQSMFDLVLPVYRKTPAASGDDFARTNYRLMQTGGKSRFMLKLTGRVEFRAGFALRLDFDRLEILEPKAKTPQSLPAKGYMIVDPDNGSVLYARVDYEDGAQEIVERM